MTKNEYFDKLKSKLWARVTTAIEVKDKAKDKIKIASKSIKNLFIPSGKRLENNVPILLFKIDKSADVKDLKKKKFKYIYYIAGQDRILEIEGKNSNPIDNTIDYTNYFSFLGHGLKEDLPKDNFFVQREALNVAREMVSFEREKYENFTLADFYSIKKPGYFVRQEEVLSPNSTATDEEKKKYSKSDTKKSITRIVYFESEADIPTEKPKYYVYMPELDRTDVYDKIVDKNDVGYDILLRGTYLEKDALERIKYNISSIAGSDNVYTWQDVANTLSKSRTSYEAYLINHSKIPIWYDTKYNRNNEIKSKIIYLADKDISVELKANEKLYLSRVIYACNQYHENGLLPMPKDRSKDFTSTKLGVLKDFINNFEKVDKMQGFDDLYCRLDDKFREATPKNSQVR